MMSNVSNQPLKAAEAATSPSAARALFSGPMRSAWSASARVKGSSSSGAGVAFFCIIAPSAQ